jgi:5-(carboxyamino)imidazole ribonucleotide synthase
LGGGQLGKMIAIEARRLGFRLAVLDPSADASARPYADVFIQAPFDDAAAALRLAEASAIVTLETEHIPAEVLRAVEEVRPVRPSAHTMATVQDRLRQREFLAGAGLPQTRFAAVSSLAELEAAVAKLGRPCILKTRRGGYDGKGQIRIEESTELKHAWADLKGRPAVLEAFVDFEREISVILARDTQGRIAYYPVAQNVHSRGILHTTLAPAAVAETAAKEARRIAAAVADGLEHIGVMAVEMFLTKEGQVLVNEIAPRVHNSGHFTLGACATSQFEQHVLAVAGRPLGSPRQLTGAVMLNLLGDLWSSGEPDWDQVFSDPTARLHLYGKSPARPGRKMGHVTLLDDDTTAALARAEALFAALSHQ